MKLAVIAPVGLLGRYARHRDYHLCLAHMLLENEEYKWFYKRAAEHGDHVIMDNSTIELGRPMDYITLVELALDVKPTEVVLPDFPLSAEATLKSARKYAPKFREDCPDVKLMGVPQARDTQEWLEAHDEMLPLVDSIGIPKSLTERRVEVVGFLDDWLTDRLTPPKEYHLLGTWGNPVEIKEFRDIDWIRGVDSKIPIRAGQQGVALHPSSGLMTKRDGLREFNFYDFDDLMPVVTTHNIKVMEKWIEPVLPAEVVPIGAKSPTR